MIEIKTDFQTFRFYHHVNVVGGFDSAENKTYLFNKLREQRTNGKLRSNTSIVLANDIYDLEFVSLNSKVCIILDEANFAPRELNDLFIRVREANAYIVTLGRLLVKQLEYSVDAIYLIDNQFHLYRMFEFSQSFNKKEFTNILTEDSTSVAAVYSDILDSEVIPVFGRSNFYKYIQKDTEPLLIADKAKFGPELLLLIERLNKDSKIQMLYLFLPESFEEIILDLLGFSVDMDDLSYFDTESMCEEILKKNAAWWNKKKVTKSIKTLLEMYDPKDSKILQDLSDICFKGIVGDCRKFFIVPIKQSEECNKNAEVHNLQAF